MKRVMILLFVFFGLVGVTLAVTHADPGVLDPTWGDDGVTLTDFGGADDLTNAHALMADGKWVVGGWVNAYPGDFGAARYLANGRLDPSFGNGGKVVTAFTDDPELVDAAWAAAARSNGGVFLVGETCDADYAICQLAVAAYNEDGSLDDSFGDDGLVVTDAGTANIFAWATRSHVQPDEKLVVGGVVFNDDDSVDLVFVRYQPDGSLDDAFGVNGIAIVDLAGVDNFVNDIVALPGDKILAVGGFGAFVDPTSLVPSDAGFLARMTSDGLLDTTFGGGDGYVTWENDGELVEGRYGLITPDNQILVLSLRAADDGGDCALQRFDMDGLPDTTFGDNGLVIIDSGLNDFCEAMAFAPDDKLGIAGTDFSDDESAAVLSNGSVSSLRHVALRTGRSTQQAPTTRNAHDEPFENFLARYHLDGTPDTTFGQNGQMRFNINDTEANLYQFAVQRDGKFLVAGEVPVDDNFDFGVLRFLGDLPALANPGALDPTWGDDGLATVDFTETDDPMTTMVLDPDGKVTIAGWVNGYPGDFGVTRLRSNGRLDPSFGDGGKVTTRFTADPDSPNAPWSMGRRADGGYVVSGDICDPDYVVCEWGTAVYLPDGSLDTSFSDDGLVITGMDDVFTLYAWPYRMVTQADGGVVIGGVVIQNDDDVDIALRRYMADGTLDPAYGDNGIALHDFEDTSNYIESMRPMPGNKILATGGFGETIDAFSYEIGKGFLALFNDDGSLDMAFGNAGYVTWDQNGEGALAEDLIVGPGGEIFVVGIVPLEDGGLNCALWRFDAQGNQDLAFGDEGVLRIDTGLDETCTSIDMLPDGKLVISGMIFPPIEEERSAASTSQRRASHLSMAANRSADVGDSVDSLVARINPDGTLDAAFGDGGLVIYDVQGAYNPSFVLAAQPDGKIVLTGDLLDPATETYSIYAARFLGDGPAAQTYLPAVQR